MALSTKDYINLAGIGASFAGGVMSGKSDEKQAGLNRQQQAANTRINALTDLYRTDKADRLQRAVGALQATSLGDQEAYATKARLMRALLGGMSNVKLTPGDPAVATAMGTRSGGFDFSSLAKDPSTLSALSEPAIAASIARRQQNLANLDPNAAIPSLMTMGLPAPRNNTMMSDYADVRRTGLAEEDGRTQDLIMQALNQSERGGGKDVEELRQKNPAAYEAWIAQGIVPEGYEVKNGNLDKKGGGFWGTLAKIGLAAAPIVAAPFTGGLSLALIGAGSGAAAGAMDGGWKGALMGGALGAIPGAGGAGNAASKGASVASTIGKQFMNPRNIANIAGAGLPGPAGTALRLGSSFLPGPKGYPVAYRQPAGPPAPTPYYVDPRVYGKVRF